MFDTVGSYGVPAGLGLSGLPHLFTYWTRGFHSRRIGDKVEVALHAMAIDEMRRPFHADLLDAARWRPDSDETRSSSRCGFPACTPMSAAGYEDTRISDMALAWMISRVTQYTDLHFDEEANHAGHLALRGGHRLSVEHAANWLAKSRSILPDHHEGAAKLDGSESGSGSASTRTCIGA